MHKFYCRQSLVRPWFIIVIFILFWCIGLLFLSGVMNGVGEITNDKLPGEFLLSVLSSSQKLGLIFFLFSSVVLAIIFKNTSSANQYYEISKAGIRCKIGPLNDQISFQEIEKIEIVPEQQVLTLAKDYHEKERRGEKDPSGETFSMDELICYSAVPFTITHTKISGVSRAVEIKTTGDFILVSLKNGKKFLLSPDQKGEFIDSYNLYNI